MLFLLLDVLLSYTCQVPTFFVLINILLYSKKKYLSIYFNTISSWFINSKYLFSKYHVIYRFIYINKTFKYYPNKV